MLYTLQKQHLTSVGDAMRHCGRLGRQAGVKRGRPCPPHQFGLRGYRPGTSQHMAESGAGLQAQHCKSFKCPARALLFYQQHLILNTEHVLLSQLQKC
jgi:hypothetical protein